MLFFLQKEVELRGEVREVREGEVEGGGWHDGLEFGVGRGWLGTATLM